MDGQSLSMMALYVMLLCGLIVAVLFLLTLQRALNTCAPASRTMRPGMIWLCLIPGVGLVWQFFVVVHVAKTFANEFRRLGIAGPGPAPGQAVGIAWAVCNCVSLIPFFGRLAVLVGMVLWIVYWNRVVKYYRMLETHQAAVAASAIG